MDAFRLKEERSIMPDWHWRLSLEVFSEDKDRCSVMGDFNFNIEQFKVEKLPVFVGVKKGTHRGIILSIKEKTIKKFNSKNQAKNFLADKIKFYKN